MFSYAKGSDFPTQAIYSPLSSETDDLFWNYLEKGTIFQCVFSSLRSFYCYIDYHDNYSKVYLNSLLDNSKCVSIDMSKGTKVGFSLYLSMPARVSYFAIRLGAKNIFHDLEENMFAVHRASQLVSSPITANIDHYYNNQKTECRVTKVIG